MASNIPEINLTSIERLIIESLMAEGSTQSIVKRGYALPQIAAALQVLLARGVVVRKDDRLQLSQDLELSSTPKRRFEPIGERVDMKIEKMRKNDKFQITHRVLAQIRDRVRTGGESH